MMQLFITYNADVIGNLLFENNEFKIEYFDDWIRNGFELSPHLSFEKSKSEDIKNFLKNLLPEGENLDDISIFLQISKYNTFSLIKEIGKDIAGAINFYENLNFVTQKQFIEIPERELENKIKNIDYENLLIWNKKVRLSIAGVGKKLPVMILNKKFGFGEGEYASTHILKFDKKELHLVENEFLSLWLAKKVGLDVNENKIIKFDDEKVLLVKRFDREFIDDKIIKKHIIDGTQLLNLPPEYKYQKVYGDNSVVIGSSIAKLSEAIDKCTTEPIKNKNKFLEWILFNLIIGNTDFHSKNLSFFIDKNEIKLTPFYDILNTAMYENYYDTNLAMSIGDNFDLNKIQYEDILDLSCDLKIKDSYVFDKLKKLMKKVEKNITKLPKKDIDEKFKEKYIKNILERMERFKDSY